MGVPIHLHTVQSALCALLLSKNHRIYSLSWCSKWLAKLNFTTRRKSEKTFQEVEKQQNNFVDRITIAVLKN